MKPTHSAEFLARNAAFNAASKAEKRVLIAQDVLAQLAAKRYRPTSGNWATVVSRTTLHCSQQVSEVLETPTTRCDCCALGGLMLSEIRHADNVKVDNLFASGSRVKLRLHHDDDLKETGEEDRLRSYFSANQLALIEIAYELGSGLYCVVDFFKGADAFAFGHRYAKDAERLVAIMENIVANKGTFKP